jgi:DNA helicase MCM8
MQIYSLLSHLSLLSGKSKNRNQGFYYLYLEAVSIINSKSQSISDDSQDSDAKARPTELIDLFSFSSKDLEFVVKFASDFGPDSFRQIVHSICPSIYGHDLVKGKYIPHYEI